MSDTDYPRPRTVVSVERQASGWYHIRVTYPGAKPTTLLSVLDRDEALRAARGYAVIYGWVFER